MSKARNTILVGERMIHPQWGLVEVTEAVPGTFTQVRIKCIQRGQGWNQEEGRYEWRTIVRPNPDAGPGAVTVYRTRTNRDQYGEIDECHVNELSHAEHAEA